MSRGLILAGKVQVNIGHFISFKSKEGFKGNIVTIRVHRHTAMRAILIRQVESGADRTVGKKLAVLTFFANIVRSQRIYLGNAHHGCRKGRADRSTGTD